MNKLLEISASIGFLILVSIGLVGFFMVLDALVKTVNFIRRLRK